MTYRITIEKRAIKFIQAQPKNQRVRIFKAINKLPLQGKIKAMENMDGFYRLRVGDYRILYTLIPEKDEITLVLVTDAGNRGQIYNKY